MIFTSYVIKCEMKGLVKIGTWGRALLTQLVNHDAKSKVGKRWLLLFLLSNPKLCSQNL